MSNEAVVLSRTSLGIEFGSTRIKAVLIDEHHNILAQGGYSWSSCQTNGHWSYPLEQVHTGLQQAYAELREDFSARYQTPLTTVGTIGISAMMHGYLPFNAAGQQICEFRTWQNTTTQQASDDLCELLSCNIPLRWSIAHLDQAILNEEAHVKELSFLTTLAGYVHWRLTGEKVLGVGDASGMFPVDSETKDYDAHRVALYNERIAPKNLGWTLTDILPRVLCAGEEAGRLTDEGAKLLDPTGTLQPGARFAPPEGDAGTGMTATNAVSPRTGNISAGTSIFSMVVLEKALKNFYRELDMVTTPDGAPVAMVHCNNGTLEMNKWVGLFKQALSLCGCSVSDDELYLALFRESLNAKDLCGGMISYNFVAGEPVVGLADSAPVIVRDAHQNFTLADFVRSQLYGCYSALCLGMKLLENENVKLDRMTVHGGLFRTPVIPQRYLASALNVPVDVLASAGEGGAYGMALLGAFLLFSEGKTLPEYLEQNVFSAQEQVREQPDAALYADFTAYLNEYQKNLPVPQAFAAI